MIAGLEWGGAQQILLLLRSGFLGVVLGVLFDLLSGILYRKTKLIRFISDIIFCLFAAMVTFFTSLVISDGLLHPVLFLGTLIGLSVSHFTIGRLLSRFSYQMAHFLHVCMGLFVVKIQHFYKRIAVCYRRIIKKGRKESGSSKKTRKNRRFFEKKT